MTDDLVVIQGNILACSYRLLSAFFAQWLIDAEAETLLLILSNMMRQDWGRV